MTLAELRAAFEAARNLTTLRALRSGIEERFRAINTEAGDADLTEERQAEWTALDAEHASLAESEVEIQRAENVRAARAKWGTTQVGTKEDSEETDLRSLGRLSPKELRSKASALLGRSDKTDHLADIQVPVAGDSEHGFTHAGLDVARTKEHVERLLRTNSGDFKGAQFAHWLLATESDAYRSAFPKLVSGQHWNLTSEERAAVSVVQEMRATMNITTDGQGGFGVPVLIDPTIILTGQGSPNDFFNIARVESITTDEWRGLTSAGATSYWTTEGVTFTDGSPTLAQPVVTTKKLTTLVKYTFEFQGDFPNWAAQMASIMAEARSEALVQAFTKGTGNTAQPQGIVTGLKAASATSEVLMTTDGTMGAADFYKIWAALPVKYRANSRWMLSTTGSNAIRQYAVGTAAADPNFTINFTEETIPRLFGKPVHYNDYMDSPPASATSDVVPVILGDWRNFLIAQRVGATIETVQHMIDTTSGNPNGTRGTFMWERIGSGVVNPNGFRYLRNVA
jgi:HK97 family phage major capsid protein